MAIFFCRALELCTFANTGKPPPSDFFLCTAPLLSRFMCCLIFRARGFARKSLNVRKVKSFVGVYCTYKLNSLCNWDFMGGHTLIKVPFYGRSYLDKGSILREVISEYKFHLLGLYGRSYLDKVSTWKIPGVNIYQSLWTYMLILLFWANKRWWGKIILLASSGVFLV